MEAFPYIWKITWSGILKGGQFNWYSQECSYLSQTIDANKTIFKFRSIYQEVRGYDSS